MRRERQEQLTEEFDRQVENLIQKGYPQVAGEETEKIIKHLELL